MMTSRRFHPTLHRLAVNLTFLLLAAFAVSCAPRPGLARGETLPLAAASENGVDVSLALERTAAGTFLLHATFTPPPGDHLYSKDIPPTGVDGLGRPTLLELPATAKMQALGSLSESVPAAELDFEYQKLLIYPAGSVTLSLPVSLPAGEGWIEDTVSVTYMACNDTGCKPPVIGKLISVQIPGIDSISD